MTPTMRLTLATVALAAFLAVSALSYHDAQDEAAHCAEMVAAGAWPDEVCDDY